MQLETERLILRNYKTEDIDDFFEICQNEKVCTMTGFPVYTERQKAVERIEHNIQKPMLFAIVYKENNKVIGNIELFDYKRERFSNLALDENTKEIGFFLHEGYWGKGLIPEAVNALLEYAFEEMQVQDVVIGHAEANAQSGRVQDKLGFNKVGILPNYRTWIDGKTTNFIQRKMTKEDWLKKKEKSICK